MNALIELSAGQLRQAARLREKIDALQSELGRLLGNHPARKAGRASSGVRRHMSASTKAKLAAIARARWKQAKAQGKSAL